MDLKNNRITMGELLRDPRSRAVLDRYFPQFVRNPLMVTMGKNKSLQQVLHMAGRHVPAQTLRQALQALQNI